MAISPTRKMFVVATAGVVLSAISRMPVQAQPTEVAPAQLLTAGLTKVFEVIQPRAGAQPQTFTARLKLVQAPGLPAQVSGQTINVAFQSPDRLKLRATIAGNEIIIGRDRQQLWVYSPQKHFGIVGSPDVPRFANDPASIDKTPLPLFKLPGEITAEHLVFLPLMFDVKGKPDEEIGGAPAKVVEAQPRPQLLNALKVSADQWKNLQLQVAMNGTDAMPVRVGFSNGPNMGAQVEIQDSKISEAVPDAQWKIPAQPGDKIQTVALAHLTRFLSVVLGSANQKIPTLPAATGKRELVAKEGKGRLELWDGTRVLFLDGTPEEMGRQQGILLKPEIRTVVNRMLYGAGVASSFAKGTWFFGEIESAQARLQPFMNERYLREMDAMAVAAGIEQKEARLANFFPELFHCSGFSVYGDATKDGHMYHGRILDYMKGMGLEPSAVVAVYRPDQGNAWVNLGYAGFIGTVTAMNEKGISIGEMGGAGEGNWDGKPMAHLLREVMEQASTLDQAIAILQRGPRTCEYYYVVSDGKTKQAVGIAATPKTFEVIRPGESHALLPHPVKNALLLSRGDRYEKLVERVKDNFGKLDAPAAMRLMERPVCMESNIQSVLFAPETLDFWVANADSQNVASHTRYTHYNLRELLAEKPGL